MAPTRETVLKLTSFRYKKEGITEQEFHDYASKDHGPKAAVVQARHGALKVAQYHTPPSAKSIITDKMPWAVRPGWTFDDHDIIISVGVRSTDDMLAIIMDPDFQGLVAGEDEICDQAKAHITAGWEEVYVENGKVVEGEFGSYEERSNVGAQGERSEVEGDLRI